MTRSLASQISSQMGIRAKKEQQQQKKGRSKQTLSTAGWALRRPRWRCALRA